MDAEFGKRCIEAIADQAMEAFYVHDGAADYWAAAGGLRMWVLRGSEGADGHAEVRLVGSVALTDGDAATMGKTMFVPCRPGDSAGTVAARGMEKVVEMCNADSGKAGKAIPEWPLSAESPLRAKPFFDDAAAEKSLDKCIMAP